MIDRNQYPSDRELAMFIAEIEKEGLLQAPGNMKEHILDKAGSLPVQTVRRTRELSTNMQLLLYSLKVCTAIACAILLLNLSKYSFAMTDYHEREVMVPKAGMADIIDGYTDTITGHLKQWKNNIKISWEDNTNQTF